MIFLPDKMRYGVFGHASVIYGDIKQIRDFNSWSVAYRRLILTRHDGKKIKLWLGLSYNAQILSQLKHRAHFEYVDG